MASEAQTDEAFVRIATFAQAVVQQFGADAIRVAERQAAEASGEIAERWSAIVLYLKTSADHG